MCTGREWSHVTINRPSVLRGTGRLSAHLRPGAPEIDGDVAKVAPSAKVAKMVGRVTGDFRLKPRLVLVRPRGEGFNTPCRGPQRSPE